MQRKEVAGYGKKAFCFKKVKELKTQMKDIEKQILGQEEQRDQLELKVEDAKKDIEIVKIKITSENNQKHKI